MCCLKTNLILRDEARITPIFARTDHFELIAGLYKYQQESIQLMVIDTESRSKQPIYLLILHHSLDVLNVKCILTGNHVQKGYMHG